MVIYSEVTPLPTVLATTQKSPVETREWTFTYEGKTNKQRKKVARE